ncbi:DUF1800 domain-containing protein [Winogradskyella sp. UBA3174]|uniref:DUF1800 domain-containing protein n=1 Tax=Winogradskyella sp. UBA3174 TaxID=1947785 RepID=UPI0025D0AB5C|nr:DUF1800 domain-containing protein [Winogradskyella sp. UBA3174]|tara:strand:- start:35437 stop:36810 length:1374 start_codon:yes stop_codon:yes gene_type:complete
MKQKELQHLYWRAGFGTNPNTLASNNKDRATVVNQLFENSKTTSQLRIDLSYLDGVRPIDLKNYPKLAKEIKDKGKKKILDLNYTWIKQLINPQELLRERMTLFWANHFVCRDRNPLYAQQYNNILRYFALGDFRDFVKAISKEVAMLRYLNGKQNRKNRPNENFARELMELFTLGEGQYSEKDIKESARAFTGYNHNFEGDFIFKQFQHDTENKIFLNSIGKHDGDDIIDIILEDRQCARFISDKIYRYFVNPKPNKEHINAMSDVFYKDYNIENLMRFVFMADWFYDEEHIGVKIKSPIEYLVGMANTVPITFERERDLLKIQKLLGQTLLDPPNVAGWKGDKAWIDANTIMVRLKLPSILLNNAMISLKEQGDFNDNFRSELFKRNKGKLPFKTLPNWDVFSEKFESIKTENLETYIIQGGINKGTSDYLKTLNKASKRDYCIQLMSLPEYQMC